MNDFRIIYAFGYATNTASVVSFLRNKMLTEFRAIGRNVSKIEIVPTKSQVEALIETGEYNLLIVREDLNDERIGNGALKSWAQRYPDLPVILYVRGEKKGGEKLKRLVSSAPFYYNVLYENDLTGENVVKILTTPRTKEEAIMYYGLAGRMEPKEAKEVLSEVKEDAALSEESIEIPNKEAEADSIEEKKPEVDIVMEDFDEMISEFDSLEFEVVLPEEADVTEPEKKKEVEVTKESEEATDYEELFSSNELFGFSKKEEEKVMEAVLMVPEDKNVEEKVLNNEDKSMEEHIKIIEVNTPFCETECSNVLPESGRVLRVLDHHMMLLELHKEFALEPGRFLEDYKMLFIVKGTKGSFVNGKYKVGVKSFEGYAGSLLGKQMLIVEVPEYDLFEQKLEGSECSIICTVQ